MTVSSPVEVYKGPEAIAPALEFETGRGRHAARSVDDAVLAWPALIAEVEFFLPPSLK
jgi:hypothetical protein